MENIERNDPTYITVRIPKLDSLPDYCACCMAEVPHDTDKKNIIPIERTWSAINGSGKLARPRQSDEIRLCPECAKARRRHQLRRALFVVGAEILTGLLFLYLAGVFKSMGEPVLPAALYFAVIPLVALASLLIPAGRLKENSCSLGAGVTKIHDNVLVAGAGAACNSYLGATQYTDVTCANEQYAKKLLELNGGEVFTPEKGNALNRELKFRSLLLADAKPVGLVAISIFPIGVIYLLCLGASGNH